jgi:hypothetical protein
METSMMAATQQFTQALNTISGPAIVPQTNTFWTLTAFSSSNVMTGPATLSTLIS